MAFDVAVAEEIWTAKYRFKTDDGKGDGSFAETAERVARAIAEAEAPEQRRRQPGWPSFTKSTGS